MDYAPTLIISSYRSLYVFLNYPLSRRYSPLWGLTSSSCRGLWPSAEAYFSGPKKSLLCCFGHFFYFFFLVPKKKVGGGFFLAWRSSSRSRKVLLFSLTGWPIGNGRTRTGEGRTQSPNISKYQKIIIFSKTWKCLSYFFLAQICF